MPDQGNLTLRGYSIEDLVNNAQAENRYGYEEVAYLLITGFAAQQRKSSTAFASAWAPLDI